MHDRRVDSWRADLDELVARARSADRDGELRQALEEVLADLESQTAIVELAPPVALLGLAPCAAGWVGVLIRPTGRTSLHVGGSLAGVVEQVREQEQLGGVALVHAEREDAVDWIRTRPTIEVLAASAEDGTTAARRDRIVGAGLTVPPMFAGMGFAEAELLAACEAVIKAAHHWS